MADLVDDMASFAGGVADQALDGLQLDLVAERRRGAVGIDVVDIGRPRCRRASCAADMQRIGAVAILGRRR